MIRLSRKAQEAASIAAADFDEAIRKKASEIAEDAGREFATEEDVKLAIVAVVGRAIPRISAWAEIQEDVPPSLGRV